MNNKYEVIRINSIPSTNLFLKENYDDFNEYTVLVCEKQSEGRGRMGRVWFSSEDNIAMSILLKPDNLVNISNISLVVGASVFNTLNRYVKCSIKWPNDIIVNDKKICGILLEAISSSEIEAVIVGIGINVNQVKFDEEIKNKATSLKLELNKDFDKDEIVNLLINNFDYLYTDFLNGGNEYMEIIRNNFYLKDKEGFINSKEKIKIIDIDNDGKLIVLKDGRIEKLNSGEITLEKFYK